MNNESIDKSQIKKCPYCGREYLKPQRYCEIDHAYLIKLSEYEKRRANQQNNINIPSSQPNTQPKQNIPKCPICQSTNLSKITTAQKAGKIALFGIFGMGDSGKTWKCNSCGSKF